jgi:hypothetical protein
MPLMTPSVIAIERNRVTGHIWRFVGSLIKIVACLDEVSALLKAQKAT